MARGLRPSNIWILVYHIWPVKIAVATILKSIHGNTPLLGIIDSAEIRRAKKLVVSTREFSDCITNLQMWARPSSSWKMSLQLRRYLWKRYHVHSLLVLELAPVSGIPRAFEIQQIYRWKTTDGWGRWCRRPRASETEILRMDYGVLLREDCASTLGVCSLFPFALRDFFVMLARAHIQGLWVYESMR